MSETTDELTGGDDSRVVYVFGPFRLVPAEFRLEREGEPPADITQMSLKLLLVLIQSPKRTVSKEKIFKAVWKRIVGDNALNVQISKLRELLRDDADKPQFIKTISGRGFQFLLDVATEWLDAETEAKIRPAFAVHSPRSAGPSRSNEPAPWIVDLTGEWNAIWETTAHNELNINHERVQFSQDYANITVKNLEASPDNKDGGYLWEARLTIHDNRHMVGAYWSVDATVVARGTLYMVLNRTGRFITGVWAGCNIDTDLACGRVALARSKEDATAEFKRLTDARRRGDLKGSPLFTS